LSVRAQVWFRAAVSVITVCPVDGYVQATLRWVAKIRGAGIAVIAIDKLVIALAARQADVEGAQIAIITLGIQLTSTGAGADGVSMLQMAFERFFTHLDGLGILRIPGRVVADFNLRGFRLRLPHEGQAEPAGGCENKDDVSID
jgi:hypothetical protein